VLCACVCFVEVFPLPRDLQARAEYPSQVREVSPVRHGAHVRRLRPLRHPSQRLQARRWLLLPQVPADRCPWRLLESSMQRQGCQDCRQSLLL
jgi:hypothetical protein